MLRSLFLSLLLAAAATAQTRPDVNGTWKQDNTRSTVRPGTKYTYWNKIEYKDPNLTITTLFTGGDRPDSSSSRTYTTDGKPTVSSDREGASSQRPSSGRRTRSSLKRWKRRGPTP